MDQLDMPSLNLRVSRGWASHDCLSCGHVEKGLPSHEFFFLSSQTPTLLLTPSPLISNIHFWSTLSPVAPLSPATRRQQAAHTLFQVRNTLPFLGSRA